MTKQEFLDELRSCLAGRVDDREIQAQISYYDSYITNELNSGKTIDEIMEQLGSPRLIAKTVLQAYRAKNDPISRQYNNREEERYSGNDEEDSSSSFGVKIWKIFALAMVLFAVLVIIGFVFSVVIYLIPVFIFIMALYLIIKIFMS